MTDFDIEDLQLANSLVGVGCHVLPGVEELAQKLAASRASGQPLTVKLGLDPTAPDVHLGHAVVLGKARQFQDAGHHVVLIIGDTTARIGDPSGRNSTRPVLTQQQVQENAVTFQQQAFLILDPHKTSVRFNSEWFAGMDLHQMFSLMSATTVAQIMERDDFSKRFKEHNPISMLELVYPLLQGFDSVAIKADVEIGGTDQTFNLMMGRNMQKTNGVSQQVVLTTPLIVGTDGVRKMSKSLGNHIGLTDTADDMFGKILSIPDAAMPQFFTLLLGQTMPDLSARDAKHQLAHRLVEKLHGTAAADAAQESFHKRFVKRELPVDAPQFSIGDDLVRDGSVHIPALLATAFGISRNQARKMLTDGAVKVHGASCDALDMPANLLNGKVLQMGRKRAVQLVLDAG